MTQAQLKLLKKKYLNEGRKIGLMEAMINTNSIIQDASDAIYIELCSMATEYFEDYEIDGGYSTYGGGNPEEFILETSKYISPTAKKRVKRELKGFLSEVFDIDFLREICEEHVGNITNSQIKMAFNKAVKDVLSLLD